MEEHKLTNEDLQELTALREEKRTRVQTQRAARADDSQADTAQTRDCPCSLRGGTSLTLQGFYTNKGRVLAAKIAAGTAGMTVTRIVAGSGHTADIPSATTLPYQKQTLHTGLPSICGSTATLPVTLLEAEAAVSYSLTELGVGVYASDLDAGEILFQV